MTNKAKMNSIIFDTNEVNAALAGRKTQHRMILSSQPYINKQGWQVLEVGGVRITDQCATTSPFDKAVRGRLPATNAAPYRIGDQLWVKEDFIPDPPTDHDAWEDEDSVTSYYQWNGCGRKLSEIPKRLRTPEHVIYKASWDNPDDMIWVKASRMRKWASRLLLEVTDIRVERILDISDTDAITMGLKPDYCDHKYQTCEDIGCIGKWAEPLMNHFIYEKNIASVRSHDWVWVVEFKAVQR